MDLPDGFDYYQETGRSTSHGFPAGLIQHGCVALRTIIYGGPVRFMAQVAIDLPIMGLMGIPRQSFALIILRAFDKLFVASVAPETQVVAVLLFFQGHLVGFLVEFR